MERAGKLLEEVQIPEPAARLRQYPHQLSGGQRQRVMIAMALANRPDILIADEPTTALDVTVQAQILNLIKDLKAKYGMAVILITHDLTIVRQFSDYVYVMQDGEVKEHNSTEALFQNPQHAYTRHLLASEPKGVANPLPDKSPVILEGRQVKVAFTLKRGGLFKPDFFELVAVDRLDLTLRKHETLGLVGESGSGKTTFGQALLRLISNQGGEIFFDGQPIHDKDRGAMRPLAQPHADRVPGPVRLAQPAHVDPPDHRGRADRQQYRRQLARAGRAGAPGAARRRAARHHPQPLSARVFRRPAPAHRHRAGHRARAGIHPARRADLGARPLACRRRSSSCCASCRTRRASAISSSRTT